MADIDRVDQLMQGIEYGPTWEHRGKLISDRKLFIPVSFIALWATFNPESLQEGCLPILDEGAGKISVTDQLVERPDPKRRKSPVFTRTFDVREMSAGDLARASFQKRIKPTLQEGVEVRLLSTTSTPTVVGSEDNGFDHYWFDQEGNIERQWVAPNYLGRKERASQQAILDGQFSAKYHKLMDRLIDLAGQAGLVMPQS